MIPKLEDRGGPTGVQRETVAELATTLAGTLVASSEPVLEQPSRHERDTARAVGRLFELEDNVQ